MYKIPFGTQCAELDLRTVRSKLTPSMQALIRPATRDDLPALAVIGPAAYADSYGYLWDSPADYAAYLHSFGLRTLEALPSNTLIWVAEVNSWIVGFLQMLPNSADPLEHRANGAEVQRIYLLKPCRSQGLGLRLLGAAERAAQSQGAEYLWLVTMRSATWAWQAYERWGFTKLGEKAFERPVIATERHLIVMRREIRDPATPVLFSAD
jgi:GNAT superfamily N-acetyltransferase